MKHIHLKTAMIAVAIMMTSAFAQLTSKDLQFEAPNGDSVTVYQPNETWYSSQSWHFDAIIKGQRKSFKMSDAECETEETIIPVTGFGGVRLTTSSVNHRICTIDVEGVELKITPVKKARLVVGKVKEEVLEYVISVNE